MLAAVEMWALRDHRKEDAMWTEWMQTIAGRVGKIDGVTATVRQPRSIDNHSPGLSIDWDPARLGITGEDLANILWTTEPRIAVGGGGRGGANSTGVSITAYMMKPEDVNIAAGRIHDILSARRPAWKPETLSAPAADLSGRWDVRIQFAAGTGEHTLYIKQQGSRLVGTHQGEFTARDFTGTISGADVRIASAIGEVHGAALSYRFTGRLEADTMAGDLDMGEYLAAKWTASAAYLWRLALALLDQLYDGSSRRVHPYARVLPADRRCFRDPDVDCHRRPRQQAADRQHREFRREDRQPGRSSQVLLRRSRL